MDQNTQEKVQKLNAAWKAFLTKQMGLGDTFKLGQGTLGIDTTDSSGYFLMADAVPPATDLFDAGGTKRFSSSYSLLLQALLPETGTGLPGILGDNYTNWIEYRTAFFKANPTTDLTQLQIFEKFANQRLDPGVAKEAITAYQKAAQAPLSLALDQNTSTNCSQTFTDAAQQSQTLRKYTPTIADVKAAINTGSGFDTGFDSTTAENSLTQTQIAGAASGFYDIFSGGASGSFDQLNTKAASSSWAIAGSVNQFKTVPVTQGCWFNQGEYSRAYNGKNDNTIWDPQSNAGSWDSFFGSDGGLARRVSQLVLISDYEITVTSKATYSESDLTKIKSEASFGVWPFFSASVSATHTTEHTLTKEGYLQSVHRLNKGLIQIWGVTVINAPD